MCNKRSTVLYSGQGLKFRIDPCMQSIISYLNTRGLETLACCCGHGIYPMTIVVRHNTNGKPLEIFSTRFIPRKVRFYIMDKEGFYYIPEVVDKSQQLLLGNVTGAKKPA